jgi:hypothetical protein
MWFDDVQVLLRVYLRNTDKYRWLSATDSLVERARRHGVAGATVVRGILGVDQAGDLLEARPWSVVQPAPGDRDPAGVRCQRPRYAALARRGADPSHSVR